MDSNLYWNTVSDKYSFSGMSFAEWQETTGHDKHSMIADPMFKDPGMFDFEFQITTIVEKIGFQPFDTSKAGVYGSKNWTAKAQLPENIIIEFDEVVRRNTGGK